MENKDLDQQSMIAISRDSVPLLTLAKNETQSDIEIYKEVLSDRFIEARTVEEYEKLIILRKKVQTLDIETRRLNYAQKSAEIQLQQAERKDVFQRGQQIVAVTVSIATGIYLLPTVPLAGLLFLILGLAKPLGYSLGEIGNFIDSLKGFPEDSDKLLLNAEEQVQTEESKDARP
jgi:hypothetical protein